jgi:hypothetical protein
MAYLKAKSRRNSTNVHDSPRCRRKVLLQIIGRIPIKYTRTASLLVGELAYIVRNETNVRITTVLTKYKLKDTKFPVKINPKYYIIEPGNSTSVGPTFLPVMDATRKIGIDVEIFTAFAKLALSWNWERSRRKVCHTTKFRHRWRGPWRIKFQSRTREHIRPMDCPAFIYQTIVYFRKENKFKTVKTWPDQCMYAVLQAQKRTHAIKV